MLVRRAATRPPVHDSAVARVSSRARQRSSTISAIARRGTRQDAPKRLRADCARPQPLELPRRAWKRDDHARPEVEDDARGGTGEPERERPLRQRRLLAYPG